MFIFLLLIIATLGPMTLNMFLPALPVIQEDFATPHSILQLSLSLGIITFALGTFFNGFLSDRIGRKPTMIIGLLLHILGNVICVFSPSIFWFIFGRVVMSYGGAGVAVVIRASISDIYGPKKSAVIYAWLAIAMVFAPMIAPSIGGYITEFFNWRMIFIILTGAGLLALGCTIRGIPETRHKSIKKESVIKDFFLVLKHKEWWIYAFLCGFVNSESFAFVSGMPYIAESILNISPSIYGSWLILTALGYLFGNLISTRLANSRSTFFMTFSGALISFFGGLIMLLAYFLELKYHFLIFLGMSVINFGTGITLPSSISAAINLSGIPRGASSAMQGLVQSLIPAIVVQYIGSSYDGSASITFFSIIGITFFCVILSLSGKSLSSSR